MRKITNSDGSLVCILGAPVQFKGNEVERVTIPVLKGKHYRQMDLTLPGRVGDIAAKVIEPVGIFDELDWADADELTAAFLEATSRPKASVGA